MPSYKNRPIRSFGRRTGRPLSKRQKDLIENVLTRIALPLDETLSQAVQNNTNGELVLEIGFGGGEHLIGQARAHPSAKFIGCEPFLDGVVKALTAIDEQDIQNIRIHFGDVRDVIERLPDACLDQIYILFPDPWPKTRHHKRRLIQPEFINSLARVLKPGARMRIATDVRSYADWAFVTVHNQGRFTWIAERHSDWSLPPQDHITTRYESKRLGDIAPVWFDFVYTP